MNHYYEECCNQIGEIMREVSVDVFNDWVDLARNSEVITISEEKLQIDGGEIYTLYSDAFEEVHAIRVWDPIEKKYLTYLANTDILNSGFAQL